MKTLTILGSTGSIGTQALDVINLNKDDYIVDSLVAGSNAQLLIDQAKQHKPKVVVIADINKYRVVKEGLSSTNIEVLAGAKSICDVAGRSVDIVIGAITGADGLAPVLSAIEGGNDIALANKESLVCAGDMVMDLARKKGVKILPVDSEHSALFQVYATHQKNTIDKIVLTASGGSFLNHSKTDIERAGVSEALNHPNWAMGRKVTVDSAGLMNKGFELIEACHLFSVNEEQIDVVVHPQSIVHSMVSYTDGSTLAQMGYPDMRTPIAYALAYPNRMRSGVKTLDFTALCTLTFQAPDVDRFPALNLCRNAFKQGGGSCVVLNASNEVAVEAFLQEKIKFGQVANIVENALNAFNLERPKTLSEFEEMNINVRKKTLEFIDSIKG